MKHRILLYQHFEKQHNREIRLIHDIKQQQFWQELVNNDAQNLILESLNFIRMQYFIEHECLFDMSKLKNALYALVNNQLPISYVPTNEMINALKDIHIKLKKDNPPSEIIKLPLDYYYSSGLSLNLIADNKMFISTHIPTKKVEEHSSFLDIYEIIILEIPLQNSMKYK